MNKGIKKIVVALAAVGLVIGVSGCAAFVTVENANGTALCNGETSTVAVSQDTAGDEITIDYTGSPDATLYLAQGFYSDNFFQDVDPMQQGTPTRAYVLGNDPNNNTDGNANLINLDPTNTPWEHSVTDGVAHYRFVGTARELYSGYQGIAGSDSPEFNYFFPGMFGFHCNADGESFPDGTTTYQAADPNSSGSTIEAPVLAAAQPFYPNNVAIDPLVVTSETVSNDGSSVTGLLHFAAGTQAKFGAFHPYQSYTVGVAQDNPDIPNNSLSNLWLQALTSADYTFELTPPTLADGSDIPFSFRAGSGPIADGNYLLTLVLSDCEEANTSNCTSSQNMKIVFVGATYNSQTGLALQNPTVEPSPVTKNNEGLANTGSSFVSALSAGIALAVLGVFSMLISRRRIVSSK